MNRITRRHFAGLSASTGLVAAAAIGFPRPLRAASGRVVVIGGGAGGATVAHYLKKDAPELDVTLIEANPQYTTCFYSNLYLGGLVSFDDITHGYDGLKALGVNVVQGVAAGAEGGKVTMADGSSHDYDRLVVAPGIDFRFEEIEGYDEAAAEIMPHAYKAGPQTQLLKQQIEAMAEGGTFVMVAPPNPFRCPPGPYERVCMVAHHLKAANPTAKIMVLDPKDKFSKQALFQEAWSHHYAGMVEWVPGEFGGKVAGVDPAAMSVTTADGETIEADVVNVIPPQKAGAIAHAIGLADDSGWCPVGAEDMASTLVDNVHVLGDASIAGDMPKSGFSANSQAKVVAMSIRAALTGSRKFPSTFRNTCWSTAAPEDSFKVGANYKPEDGKITSFDGFISQPGESAELRAQTRLEADGWYDSISKDIFAKG